MAFLVRDAQLGAAICAMLKDQGIPKMDKTKVLSQIAGTYDLPTKSRWLKLCWFLFLSTSISLTAMFVAFIGEPVPVMVVVAIIVLWLTSASIWIGIKNVKRIVISPNEICFQPVNIAVQDNDIVLIKQFDQLGTRSKCVMLVSRSEWKIYLGALYWAGKELSFWIPR
ncbi:hypothetical protein J7400_21020 [Shimia sp. R9_2]|uniref:hypothetical protein n=1 Tax=Shimia sp. R9_2 TaxID=2821112 RepID=UPI001ADAECDB|nr:hypothetical protein [Shimia sp. R9_2]MBO9399164.1 hypothetical protein [Shimia sp. R9_2]